jgi:hypothetical protein
MSNRNLNGLSSSVRSLNGLSTQLKDGKGIKVSNKNEIDVNMKTNTTEQTTIGDTDLFLLSDTTGANIKHITGINLKQKALLHLVGGTNINLTNDSSNDTVINLDSQIELQKTTIIKNPKSTSFPTGFSTVIQASGAQEGFDEFRIVADGSPNIRKLIGITATTVSANHTLDFNNGIFTNVETINGSHTDNLALNNNNQNFLIKPSTVNFSTDDIFSVDSNSKITNITRTTLLNTLTASNGLIKNTNDIKISSTPLININQTATFKNATGNAELKLESGNDVGYESRLFWFNNGVERARFVYSSNNNKFDLLTKTGSIHLKAFQGTNDGTSRLLLGNGSFELQAGSASVSLTNIIKGTLTDVNIYKNTNFNNTNLTGVSNINSTTISQLLNISAHPTTNTLGGVLKILHPTTTAQGDLRDFEILNSIEGSNNDKVLTIRGINNTDTTDFLQIGDYGSIKRITSYVDFTINIATALKFNVSSNSITLANTNSFIVLAESTMNINKNGSGHLDYEIKNDDGTLTLNSTGGTSQQIDLQISSTNKISILSTTIDIFSNTDFNQNILYLKGGGNANHYIRFRDIANVINGARISGYGTSNRAVFDVVSQSGTADTVLFNIFNDKINMYKTLYMNSAGSSGSSTDRPIYLHTDTNFYIKYLSNTSMNGTDIAGFSNVRLHNTQRNTTQLLTYATDPATGNTGGSIMTYNKLAVIKNNATLQNDSNDIFTVRNTGFTKMIVHSDSGDVELALKCGSDNSNQAVIKRKTNDQLLISNQGEYRVEVSNNTCNFVNNNGRLAWQSDRNLVIYNSGGGAIFASNTSTSERRFKDNIVSLDLENSYNIIKQLNPVSFVYIEEPTITKKGFIVDEIEDKIPECIKEITNCDCEDMKSKLLYKEDIVPDLVASVKYLMNEVETLKQQLLTQSNLQS